MQIVFFIVFLFTSVVVVAQNVYDSAHVKVFADYLFQTKQYQFAAEEYFRAGYNDLAVDGFLTCGNNKSALEVFENHIFSDSSSQKMRLFYVKLLILNGNYSKAYSIASQLKQPYTVRAANICALLPLIDTDIKRNFSVENPDFFSSETEELLRIKPERKSVGLGVAMSSIIPGSGKLYAGNIYDGATTMILLGLDAFHIVRGIKKYGLDPYPLFFAFFGVSFYVGNIFGTAKAIKIYNKKQKQQRDEKIVDYLNSSVF